MNLHSICPFFVGHLKGVLTSQGDYKDGKLINGTARKPDFDNETDSDYILVEYKDGKRFKITPCDEEGNVLPKVDK